MGQRLNIEIKNKNRTIASAYYHWSAYSESAAHLTRKIIQEFYDHPECSDLELAVDLLQSTGAGINEFEREEIARDKTGRFSSINFIDAVDRNKGLLSVTKKGIEDNRRWEEGRVTIDISSQMVDFEVFWSFSENEYIEEYMDGKSDSVMDLPLLTLELSELTFSQACDLPEIISESPGGVRYYYDDGNAIIGWIA